MALLKLNNQLNYIEPVLLPQGGGASRSLSAPNTTNIVELDPSESSLELSPNPASALFVANYKVLEPCKNLQLRVTDLSGKEIYLQKLKDQRDEVIIPCGNLQPGTYVVGITGEGIRALSQKLVIQK